MTLPTVPGPDPHPEPVAGPLPPGACDCHAHIMGPAATFPFAEGRGYTPPDAGVGDYLRLLDTLGLARGVVVQSNAHGLDNAAALDAASRHPDRLRAVVITPGDTTSATLHRWHALGARGVRVHLFHPDHRPAYRRGVPPEAAEAMLPVLRHLGWHVQAWADHRALPDHVARLARLAAAVPLVLDHLAESPAADGPTAPGFQAVLRLVRDAGAWAKLSAPCRSSLRGPDYPDVNPLHDALIRAAADRMLWGTDWPHPGIPGDRMPNDGRLLNRILARLPDAALRRAVLSENPARLYGFPAA